MLKKTGRRFWQFTPRLWRWVTENQGVAMLILLGMIAGIGFGTLSPEPKDLLRFSMYLLLAVAGGVTLLILLGFIFLAVGPKPLYRQTTVADQVRTLPRSWKVPPKRWLFTTAFIVLIGVALYQGWYPNATQVANFLAGREGTLCYGDFGYPGVPADFYALPKPGGDPYVKTNYRYGDCIRGLVTFQETPGENSARLKIEFWREGRNRKRGQIESGSFKVNMTDKAQRIPVTWDESDAVYGLDEGDGWIQCRDIHARGICMAVLTSKRPDLAGQHRAVTFHRDQRR